MRRFSTYLAEVVAMIIATACTMSELLEPTFPSSSGDNLITISPRITHYTDYDVTTRSAKEGLEAKVTSMAMALFPIVEGQIQPSVYYQYNADGNMLFVLDRNKAPFTDSNDLEPYKDKNFVMYIIANMQDAGIPKNSGYVDENGKVAVYQPNGSVVIGGEWDPNCGAGWTADEFVAKYHTIEDGTCFEKIGDNGLPMIGMLGDFSEFGDKKTFIFHPTKGDGNENGLPVVNGTPTDNLEIPMRALYAKFSFTINVDSEQEIVGNPAPRFDLLGYQVFNASSKVYLSRQLNEDHNETDYKGVATSEFHNVLSEGLYAQGATKATFSFYVPERYLTPNTPASEYEYDFGENGGICKGYEKIPAELKKYAQRFKPELVNKEQNATHVAIKGKFTDHQKHVYNITYRIYLGKDNYGDFNIIRNTHYNNFITIKGIDNSDDQSAYYDPTAPDFDPDAIAPISIDHRVTIERTTPLVVDLRRETLLDSHFEVRPLRLHLSGGDQDTNPIKATVTLKKVKDSDPELSTWIAMEKSGNSGDHITGTGTPSDGKRKFFTTDLISSIYSKAETNDDGNIVIEVDGLGYKANQTVWLYADENTTTASRSAVLQIDYDYNDAAPENYIITQHGLFKVTGADSGRDYYIENFEEYLYNYDVEDIYSQTKQEGMPWGLNGVQLSKTYTSFDTDKAGTEWKSDYTSKYPLPYYDFYTKKHDGFATDVGGTVREYPGHAFTKEIAGNSNAGIQKLTLADPASSAVEYCYNRNKRQSDGTIKDEDIVWYLPSADELEDFIVPAYSSFKEFQDNYYWTSQPAYIRNIFYYEHLWYGSWLSKEEEIYAFTIYEDNTEYSRATKVVRKNGEFEPAPSGLNAKPTTLVDNRAKNGKSDYVNLNEYFYMMRYWKFNERALSDRKQYGQDKKGTANAVANGIDPTNGDYDEWYTETSTGKKYYVHLGHLYNMIQKTDEGEHGYHQRTKNNRVRCVRVKPTE